MFQPDKFLMYNSLIRKKAKFGFLVYISLFMITEPKTFLNKVVSYNTVPVMPPVTHTNTDFWNYIDSVCHGKDPAGRIFPMSALHWCSTGLCP